MTELPQSIRYIKLGAGARWWSVSKANGQIHAGWSDLPDDLIARRDYPALAVANRALGGTTQDLNALFALLDHPSQHIWITIADGFLWWCTVSDDVTLAVNDERENEGHFWLSCTRPWSNRSIAGRLLSTSELPGSLTQVARFQATVCQPSDWPSALRIIQNEHDPDAVEAESAKIAYEGAIQKIIQRLSPKDFELLIELILSRSGWARTAKLGGPVEGIDIEAQNPATGEIAFVQVKSKAGQSGFDQYIKLFQLRRDHYDRMIFVVHTSVGELNPSDDYSIQLWTGAKVASLTVQLGLGDWASRRLG